MRSLLVATMVALVTACQTAPAADFDAKVWRERPPSVQPRENPRYAMAPTLVEKHLKPGMARAEVHKLLGPPEYPRERRDEWSLGFPPLRMDMALLVIDYDAGDRLTSARVALN